jgi:hypothetical protein
MGRSVKKLYNSVIAAFRQACSLAACAIRTRSVAGCAPWDLLVTVFLPDQRVAAVPAEDLHQMIFGKGGVEGTDGVAFASPQPYAG